MTVKCVVCGEPWDSWGLRHGDVLAWEYDLFKKGAGCPACKGVRPEGGGFRPEGIHDLDNGDEDPMERVIAYADSLHGAAPEWKPPEREVLRTCAGCGIQLVRDLAEEIYDGDTRKPVYEWYTPPNSNAYKWYISHNHRQMGDPEEAAEDHNWQPWSRVGVIKKGEKAYLSHDVHGAGPYVNRSEVEEVLKKHNLSIDDVDLYEVGREDVVCPCCYQMCNDCGEEAIATVAELGGDAYDLGSSFLPAGRHHMHDAVCRSCFEDRCSNCGHRVCDCCTCDDHGGEPHEESSECCNHLGHRIGTEPGWCERCHGYVDEEND